MRRGAHGIGLRAAHYSTLLEQGLPASTGVGFAEAIIENFLGRGGRPRAVLERVRADVQVVFHGVSMSLGGFDPIDRARLRELRALCRDTEASWVSDHLCFSSHGGHHVYDLWPLPFTEECVLHVAARIRMVQEELGASLLVENVSSYVEHTDNEMPEWTFVRSVLEEADCGLLLDVNNVYVNARNHGFAAERYLAELPAARVRQMHVAGHLDCGDYLLDDHGREVSEPVWALFREAQRRFGEVPTIVEWDGAVPPLERVISEAQRCGREQALAAALAQEKSA
jgi:uncharacterized protein (UPF0276 family)